MTSDACLKKAYPGEIGFGGMVGDGKEGAWLGKLQLDSRLVSREGRSLGQLSSSWSWFDTGLRSGCVLSMLS